MAPIIATAEAQEIGEPQTGIPPSRRRLFIHACYTLIVALLIALGGVTMYLSRFESLVPLVEPIVLRYANKFLRLNRLVNDTINVLPSMSDIALFNESANVT